MFSKTFSCMQGQYKYRQFLQLLVVTYDIGFLRLNGSGLFSLFKVFLETKTTKSPPIIVRECMFKNQNLCFASR